MNKTILFILILFFYSSSSKDVLSQNNIEVIINEICTNNQNIIEDKYGNYSSWIELYNKGESAKDISGFGLSNEEYIPLKWTFPKNTIIDSKKYLIIFISDKKSLLEELHTNFELNPKGDLIILSSPKGELIEKIEIPKLKKDISYGRTSHNTFLETNPTPGRKNEIIVQEPIFSEKSGFFENEFFLTLSSPEEEVEIYYTLDSSNPQNSSTAQIYKKPIKIYDRSSEPNFYAEIGDDENSPLFIGSMGGYKKPKYLIDKAMVVRAYSKNKEGKSNIVQHTYFVTTGNLYNYKDFTVVSLVTNPENLFDPEKGIYVVGKDYIEKKNSLDEGDFRRTWELMYASNFYKEGDEWEKETNIAIFENGKISLQQNVGIKIRGFSTRMQAGKSFNVYAKKRFGKSSIDYTLFSDNFDVNKKLIKEYKSIALRNVFSEERIKDEFANKLLYGREFQSISKTRKCILFLNGEYWGFYIMLEKFSESYISSHFDVPKNGVTLIKEGELSNGEESELELYNNFFNEYSKKDLTEEQNYQEVKNFVDIDSLIEHFVIGVYIGTWDWPGHNDGVWRYNGEKIENNLYSDGRWRYISFDFDYSMGASFSFGRQEEQVPYAIDNLKGLERRKNVPTILFLPLLKNKEFRNKYIVRFCDYVNEIFNLDRIDSLINDYTDNYLDKLTNGKVRWKGYEYENELEAFANFKTNYIKNFDNIRTFFVERPKYALQHMKEYLNIEDELNQITIIKEGEGKIKINSIIPEFKEGKWIGKYYGKIPISITAIPSENSTFKGWNGEINSNEMTITIELTKDTTIKAQFD